MTPTRAEARPAVWYDEATKKVYHDPHDAPEGATVYVSRPFAKAERDALVMGMIAHILSTDLDKDRKRPTSPKVTRLWWCNVGVVAAQVGFMLFIAAIWYRDGAPLGAIAGMGIIGIGTGMGLAGLLNYRLIERAYTVGDRVSGHLDDVKAKLDSFDPFEEITETKH